jgi:ATP-dependent Clp protease ATP-binding subunit ClpA
VPKINVYLPGWLADAVRESTLPVSAICQRALSGALASDPGGDRPRRRPVRDEVEPLLTNRALEVLRHCGQATVARLGADLAMLSGIEAEGGNLALVVLGSLGIGRDRLRAALPDADGGGHDLDALIEQAATAAAGRGDGHDVDGLIEQAATAAADLGSEHIGCEHLLLALAADPTAPAARLLAGLGAEPATLTRATRAATAAAAYARAAALDEVQARLTTLDRQR